MAIKKILVPLDGSENAEKVMGWVAGIAVPLRAAVVLTTVIDPNKIELPETAAGRGHPFPGARDEATHVPAPGAKVLDPVMQQADEYLAKVANRLRFSGVESAFKSLPGEPAEAIIQHARQTNADMIAMATHRGSAIARGVLGSVTDRVIRGSDVPVLAVHPASLNAFTGAAGQPEVVVVPIDGSERSGSAVGMALDIAAACASEVVFVRVVQNPYDGVTAMDAASYSPDYDTSGQRHEAEKHLEPFVTYAKERGLNARQMVLVGAPAARILDKVKALSRPLIVMSTRGAGGVKRWMTGSVTDKIVRSSGLPVLVIPPRAE
jgi:nucleotide-binding universal stress UspA family protein